MVRKHNYPAQQRSPHALHADSPEELARALAGPGAVQQFFGSEQHRAAFHQAYMAAARRSGTIPESPGWLGELAARRSGAVPDTPENLADFMLSAYAARSGHQRGDLDPRTVFRAYAAAAMERDPGLRDQMREQLGGRVRDVRQVLRPGDVLGTLYRPDAPGAKLDGLFAGVGDYLAAVMGGRDPRLGRVREVRDSYGSELPDAGGFLVPEELRSDLVLFSLEQAIVRPRCLNVPQSTLRTGIPALDATSNVSTILGGFTGYWVEESATITTSTPAFERIVLDAKKLVALGDVPNELLQDAPAFDVYMRTVLPSALGWWEDQALIAGTGVGEPEGALNAACAISVTRGTASHIKHADVIAMLTRMWPAGITRATWLCSPDAFTELLNVYLLIGTVPTSAATSPPNWLEFDGTMWRLLGVPLIVTEHVKALGTKGDLMLCDLSLYLLGTRELLTVDTSAHSKWSSDVTEVKIRSRVDGRMWPQSALSPANGSQTVSPVVILN